MPKTAKVSRNCRHCNGVVKMRKATSSMLLGNCEKCKRTYALINAQSVINGMKLVA